ncbi:MAG TPA: sulfate permease [Leptospiraceae bacterium]|nr:sulfate permease [Leptospirales bacterium]HMU83316.1 sulfate permease [Leptospiraceae bacterium]HMX55493.1 sulfate permease [Leptospiraceae bacterium]HMZ35564.1 sulfate permease [Leptospiraceae bacterium]HNJ32886.1 sulfate permease [Leptospiraceae bacterium]
MLKPKLFTLLREMTPAQLLSDLTAGVIVGVVALPLAIAFAIASGVSPERGLYTAIIGGFIISFLGGSRVQIGGPTGAFVVIVYAIVEHYGYPGLAAATLMAGVILIIMGLARFGSAIKFIPHPVIVGFTSGIAVIIFSAQIRDVLGLSVEKVPADFIEKWVEYVRHISSINVHAAAISGGCLLVLILWPLLTKRIPASLVALVGSTAIVYFLNLPVETIGSRFGSIPSTLPAPSLPEISFQNVRNLIQPAFTIAMLGGIEALLSAVVADGMIGSKHRSNMELVANGVANVLSPLFGGIPATGAIARTATNIKNGARTPVAGIIHAITLLLIMLLLAPLARLIPMACLGAILIVVAYNMSEWRTFVALLKTPKSDVIVLLITFGLTVIVDLTVAIEVGLVLAAFLFMNRMAHVTNIAQFEKEFEDSDDLDDPLSIHKRQVPDDVRVFEINGPFFFGAAYKFEEALQVMDRYPRVIIIRMRNVPAIDSTGMHVLKQVHRQAQSRGTQMVLSGVHTQPLFAMEKAGMLTLFGEDNIFGNIDDALNRAREVLGLPRVERPGEFVPTVAREGRPS